MVDEKPWRMAVSRFRLFRSHLRGPISHSIVVEYHSILNSIEVTSGYNLQGFSISSDSMGPRLLPRRAPMRKNLVLERRYSSSVFCDSVLFERKLDDLGRFIESVSPCNFPSA
jgi:hypothetical protein